MQREQYLELLKEKVRRQEGLPHLHGWKFYKWAREYFETTNPLAFLCAANQISKSSTQLRRHIHRATEPTLWPKLWPRAPRMFWYLYPTRDVAHVEFKTKWEPEFMPRNEFKTDPQYGWKPEFYHNRIFAIHWNSGVSTYFKTYAQDVQDLQTGTVWEMDLDEEPPEDLMGELFMRLAATDGHMSAVFTPTTGAEYWRLIMEERGAQERFPTAFKRQVSMFDCMEYEDGTKSHWTEEKINRAINSCKSPQEVERRVFGKFVVAENLKYPSFHRTYSRKKGHPLPKDWDVFVGADVGSGGTDNHPSAICLVGVSPDRKQGRVFKGWRGDGIVTDAGAVVNKVVELTRGIENVQIYYDWACRDFLIIAQTMGLHVQPAEKSHAIGEQLLNVLFKNQMLLVYDYEELDPLCLELASLKTTTPKNKAKDDFADALRYAVSRIPWNFDAIRSDIVIATPKPQLSYEDDLTRLRRAKFVTPSVELVSVEDEIAGWNEMLESL